ncbi:MAG TPA: HAMP domain-containing histidine kinase [Hellea balneolensis]|uniref:histidine kinase n=1 Tax=Hellea balneolensis TaxID=287478 RepID=A0A7C5QWZ5_9PROT|nr:HAMP domain-containing histidine kinase [Hellea balneolensis]
MGIRMNWRGLSSKLLLLTILFVMLAEGLIFFPSAAMFRQNWLWQRAESAGLITLAIEGVPNYEGSSMLSEQFMKSTSVTMVAQNREGMSELVLGMPPSGKIVGVDDLRKRRRLPLFRKTFRDFFGDGQGYIRVLSHPTVKGVDSLEFLVPQARLKAALRDYSARVLLWSIVISLMTGLLIYFALTRMIVVPVKKLATGLANFRNDPRKRQTELPANFRKDEIGQLEREFVDMKDGVRLAFQRQERLATLGMAMAKINHDLRNVLTSTQLISDRLASDPDERISRMGQRLVKTVDRGVKLCEATLSFSQSVEERPKIKPVRIATLIGEAAGDTMAEEGQVKFTNKVPHNLQALVDPDHTYRIFHNLFRNAIQAMTKSDTQDLSVDAKIKDDKLHINISDTGPGLPEKAKSNLFKAFTSSTTKGGTGLGLTISRELARAQGGNLILEKTGPDGTTFTVCLPLYHPDNKKPA